MKKILSMLMAATAALLLSGCAKVGEEFLHTDYNINSIEIRSTKTSTAAPITGKIDQETGEILFEIPPRLRDDYDPKAVKVRASVGYDVMITPSLSGIKDLSEPYEITCTAKMTGESRKYSLKAKYVRQ